MAELRNFQPYCPFSAKAQWHKATKKVESTTQLTPVVRGGNGAQRSWHPFDHLVNPLFMLMTLGRSRGRNRTNRFAVSTLG
ncbi:hypothetical protein ACTXGQ_33910, partial [Marinobacter sp. 1Y8]